MRSESWKSLQSMRGWQGESDCVIRSVRWRGKEQVVEESKRGNKASKREQ